jgi:hypothetical protein
MVILSVYLFDIFYIISEKLFGKILNYCLASKIILPYLLQLYLPNNPNPKNPQNSHYLPPNKKIYPFPKSFTLSSQSTTL